MLKFIIPVLVSIILLIVFLSRADHQSAQAKVSQSVESSDTAFSQNLSKPNAISFQEEEVSLAPVTAEEITAIENVDQAAQIHHRLALSLIAELRDLSKEKRPEIITRELKPTAEKFYFLKRAVTVKGLPEPNYETIGSEQVESIRKLKKIWDENQELATTADSIYSKLGLLDCEHVPYLLRRWIQKSDRPQDL